MRSGIPYPDEKILIIRPCLVSLCIDVRPAAKLLSFLLYRYSIRQESREDAENLNEVKKAQGQVADQDTSYRIYRKQAQLVKDLAGECTAKTLHDVAVPCLQLLGYVDFEDAYDMPCYTLHINRVLRGLEAYSKDLSNKTHSQLEKFLKEIPVLEKFLIVKSLEIFLIDKKNFQLELKKFLIENRNSSNCKRGRKPRIQEASEGDFATPKSVRENKENVREYEKPASVEAGDSLPHSLPHFSSGRNIKQTVKSNNGHLIANMTTSSRPITEPLDQGNLVNILEPEERRIFDLLSEVFYAIPPEVITSRIRKQCAALAPHVRNAQDLESLRDYTRTQIMDDPIFKDKRAHLGNLVSFVNGWKQEQMPLVKQAASKKRKMTDAERNALPL